MKIEYNNLKTNSTKSRSIGIEHNNLKINNAKSRSIGVEHNNLKINNAKSRSIGVEHNNLKTNNTESRSIGKNIESSALLFAIITIFVMCMIASTFVLLTTNQYRIMDSEINRTIDFYLEQAGIEWAIYNLYQNIAGWLPPIDGATTTHTLPPLTVNGQNKIIEIIVYNLPVVSPPAPTFSLNTSADYGIQVRMQ